MPIYEYVCKSCKKEFEVIRPMSQKDAPIECEKCGSKKVKRKLAVIYAHNEQEASPGLRADVIVVHAPAGIVIPADIDARHFPGLLDTTLILL